MVSRYVGEHISPQLRASVLLLLELLFIRDGSFSCSLPSLHDTNELVDFIMHILMLINYNNNNGCYKGDGGGGNQHDLWCSILFWHSSSRI